MDIMIISGFLGSGKTTVLLRLAKALVENTGMKVAIIENEVGKIGVDGQMIKAEGLAVKELFSGCICCTLKSSLSRTLVELARDIRPDIVIVEPSGVAVPDMILEAMSGTCVPVGKTLLINLVDATRSQLIFRKPLLPVVGKGIETADMILVNKADAVGPELLSHVEAEIYAIRPEANLHFVSALTGDGMESILTAFEEDSYAKRTSSISPGTAEFAKGENSERVPDASVFAEQFNLSFSSPQNREALEQRLGKMLEDISVALEGEGKVTVGHIKAIIKDDEVGGYLQASLTDFGTKPRFRGAIDKPLEKACITLNVIVYGIGSLSLSVCMRKLLGDLS